MGYKYRKKKRDLCNIILSHQDLIDHVLDDESDIDDLEERAPTIKEFKKWHPKYSYEEFRSALSLLEFNKHISLYHYRSDPNNLSLPYIIPTYRGIEAYNEGYYEKENQKDYLEIFELKSKWIIPLITLTFSAIALTLSLLAYFRPHR